ncbi:hypothetical protein [Microbacterium ulmi]|uniref:DUF998 domain-containing protein n=1 Tax=Microbacterium ulmi TaxID=179095 RepID=A0A7Y2M2F4_9MICO|nr:hypothetical protein [Microbacterium ulmi]NII68855.1 uncharacterized protein YhhL (DUF1145 family) [Microbacterium ulmi]NNH05265.1 hypothetical protein [Microbacterium ulmi]
MARIGGWAAVVAGVTGVAGAVFLLVVPPAASPDVFNYPLSPTGFVVVQVAFGIHHVLTAVALWAFWRAGFAGRGRFADAAGLSAAATMAMLGVWELVVISGNGAPYPSDDLVWIDVGYGTLSLLSGVALVLLGVAAVRARVLAGVWRWVVLAIGIWVFVPMTPALAGGFVLGRVAIGTWLLLFALLGWAMLRWATDAAPRRSSPAVAAEGGAS